jgi:hypothetical protein
VKIIWHGEQQTANDVEHEPCDKDAHHRPRKRPHYAQPHAARTRRRSDAREATRADDAVLVFDDTFAAKETTAFRTARDGFALDVMEAALEGQRRHLREWAKLQDLVAKVQG